MLGVAKMNEIIKIAKNSIKVLEDNCETVGGKYNNSYLGTIGDIGIFSFDYGKMITTEKGMVLTNKKNWINFVVNTMIMGIKIILSTREVEIQKRYLALIIEYRNARRIRKVQLTKLKK